ncbi:Creatinine amidohydrolase [hydrothermal vent metagenome]|uniref:Creatinine amidohydrolase n=1 Tax=hydrothermal vent metagenome TaxID=652676 RepID=A0A3B0TCX8_9ZZZZ
MFDKSFYFDEKGDHAGEMETSLMLCLKPELVLPKKMGRRKYKKYKIKAFTEGWVWASASGSQISEDTGVGNPHKATKEIGTRFF